jgi:methionyl-tRNA formyltransferase
MDAGLDTGAMLLREAVPIAAGDTTASLHDKLAALGARLVARALELAACGGLEPVAQPEEGVTYAHKIEKAEAAVDWSQPAEAIARRVRAFDPFPGATGVVAGEVVKLWAADALAATAGGGAPGLIEAVAPDGLHVRCGSGTLRITQLQRAGGKRLPVADFLRGFELKPGMVFESRPS